MCIRIRVFIKQSHLGSTSSPGISVLEKHGILHRDISAGNVLLSENGGKPDYEAFLTDFEFAKLPQPGSIRKDTCGNPIVDTLGHNSVPADATNTRTLRHEA